MRDVALALAATTAVGLLAALIVVLRARTQVRRRVELAVARIGSGNPPEPGSLGDALDALEGAVDSAAVAGGDSSASETRMVHALSAIEAGIVLFDDAGEIVFSNPQAALFLSARYGEAVVESSIEELARRALEGHDGTQTLELFGPPRRTLVLTADPLDDGYRSIGALVVIDDVTERRRIDAVRRDFVANISHELKTPVGGLGVLAETLVDYVDLTVLRGLAERMNLVALRASRTIDDLLELSRIEAGEPAVQEPVAVHLVLAEAVERAASAAEHRGINLDLQEPPHGLLVRGDRRQLASAIFNLLDNAIKYSEPGSVVQVRGCAEGGRAHLVVADDGIGIPRRDLERIFERFYRVDRARSRDTGGTGLGLAIVRHVASNHGGEITVESREGEGSVFSLLLPVSGGPATVIDDEEEC